MRFFVGFIIFWVSIIGYLNIFKRRFKIPLELLFPLLFTCISLIIFLAGILNMLKVCSLLICLGGIVLLFYDLFKKRFVLPKYLNINIFIILAFFLYFTIICFNMHVMHYDNYSHWALICKCMFIKDAFPNFSDFLISFKGYQPGSACFIYYVSLLLGKNEGSMIIAQNYLLISFFFSLLVFTDNNKNKKINYIMKALVIVFYLFIILGNIKYNDLLVDSLISAVGICICAFIYYFKKDLKKQFINVLPLCIFIFLIKNIGLVLVGFVCIYYFIYGINNKMIKKGFKYSIITGLSTLLFFYIWSRHVSYVFDFMALGSNHTLSSSHILYTVRQLGINNFYKFITVYFNNFIDVLHNIPNIYMIIINGILVILIVTLKKCRKSFIKCLLISDLIYLSYYLILGFMYVISFNWDEMIILAGFTRYMMSIVYIIIGIVLIFIINNLIKYYNNKKYSYIIVCCLIIGCLFINYKYSINGNFSLLVGDFSYKDSIPYKFDRALNDDFYKADSVSYFYIYKHNHSVTEGGYTRFLSKYKLYTHRYKYVDNIDDIKKYDREEAKNFNKRLIILENDEDINKYIKNNDYKKLRNNYYVKYLKK